MSYYEQLTGGTAGDRLHHQLLSKSADSRLLSLGLQAHGVTGWWNVFLWLSAGFVICEVIIFCVLIHFSLMNVCRIPVLPMLSKQGLLPYQILRCRANNQCHRWSLSLAADQLCLIDALLSYTGYQSPAGFHHALFFKAR